MATTLSERVRRAREAAALPRAALAEASGLHRGHILKIEGGARPELSAATADALARALGVSLDWLIRGEGPEPEPEAVRAAVERARAQRTQEAA